MTRRVALVGGVAVLAVAALAGGAMWATSSAPPAGGGLDAGPISPAVAESERLGEVAADQPLTIHVLMPASGDQRVAEKFLRANGLAVTVLPRSGLLTATGPARSVDAAFRVRIYRWHNPATGEDFFANDHAARLPFAVDGLFGLDDAFRVQPLDYCQGFLLGHVPFATYCGSGYRADQVRKAYGVQSLNDAGLKGDGQTVAIYALSGFSQQYIDDFDLHNNLIAPTISVTHVVRGHWLVKDPAADLGPGQGLDPSGDGGELELEMDIEAVHAIADHAAIHVYEMDPGLTMVDFLRAVAYFHEHVASISTGACQDDLGARATVEARATKRLVEQEQISVFAASGDTGQICPSLRPRPQNNSQDYEIGVLYPASDPSVTAVGGTNLKLNPDDTMSAEEAWDQHDVLWRSAEPQASGGGPAPVPDSYKLAFVRDKTSFPRPQWQVGAGVPPGTQRLVPDVAAMSVPGLTISVNPRANQGGNWLAGGGTSLAAPLWAGFAAVYNQDAQSHGAPLLGFANPLLYRLAGRPDHPFFDVTTDQTPDGDLAGHAASGWDFATGLGSFNAAAIIQDGVTATSRLDIRTVNWAELKLPSGTCGSSTPVQLHGGLATNVTARGGYKGFGAVAVEGPGVFGTAGANPVYGDLAGDGRTQAAVRIDCDTGGFVADSTLGDSILVYGVDPDNHLLLLGVLPSTHVSFGTHGATGRLDNIQVVRGAVMAVEHYYNSADDPGCCPTGLAHQTWAWKAAGGFGSMFTPHG